MFERQSAEVAKVKAIISKLGFRAFVELLFHPVLVPLYVIPAWGKSLLASRILLQGRWSRYHGFHAQNAINNLFYRTQWININRYGRLSKSPILGLGNYSLSNWWFLSSLASYIYANAGAATTLLGTLFWILSHLIWLQTTDWHWVLFVTAIVFFSSTAYLMAFARQNYQILGWMLLPIAFYGLLNDQLVIATLAFFAAALMGFTALFVSIILVFSHALQTGNFHLLLVLLPAIAVTTLNFIELLRTGNLKSSVLMIGKLIGLIPVGVKYKRKSMKVGLFTLYFLSIYAIAIFSIWIGTGRLPVLLTVVYGLFFLNQRLARFADEESLLILFVGVSAVEVLSSSGGWYALAGLFVAANPITFVLDGISRKDRVNFCKPYEYQPFDTEPLLSAFRNFLDVKPGSRILFAFDDPNGDYGQIFDGYRVLLEAPLVVAAENSVHLFPDWYAVSQTNYVNAPTFWGRSFSEVGNNVKYWNADYVIVYQDSGTDIEPGWLSSFRVISEFDWGHWVDGLRGCRIWSADKPIPKWWLLAPEMCSANGSSSG